MDDIQDNRFYKIISADTTIDKKRQLILAELSQTGPAGEAAKAEYAAYRKYQQEERERLDAEILTRAAQDVCSIRDTLSEMQRSAEGLGKSMQPLIDKVEEIYQERLEEAQKPELPRPISVRRQPITFKTR